MVYLILFPHLLQKVALRELGFWQKRQIVFGANFDSGIIFRGLLISDTETFIPIPIAIMPPETVPIAPNPGFKMSHTP